MTRAAVVAVLLVASVQAAVAEGVYRCGPDGRQYADQPCGDGHSVDAADPRSQAQRDAAAEVARHDAQAAQRLADERQKREAHLKPAGATAIRGQRLAHSTQAASSAQAGHPPKKSGKRSKKKPVNDEADAGPMQRG